jgi:hypothetical protein
LQISNGAVVQEEVRYRHTFRLIAIGAIPQVKN